jgi:hypothetical protein
MLPTLPGRRVAAAVAATLAVLALQPGAATARQEEDGVRWAVQPSGPDGPTGRNWFVYDLTPGAEIVDWVAVTNLGDSTLDFAVYPTDAYTTSDGSFALLPADQPVRDLGGWVAMEAGRYRVPAGQRVDIPFRLTVPANATPGDHAGGIIAAITARQTSADGQQLDLERRVAARIYLRVDGPAQPAVRVESVRVSYDNPIAPWGGYAMTVTYVLRNTGNLRVTGAARVRVDGPFGWWRLASTGDTEIPELLPGSTLTVTETISGLAPAGRLTAAVQVDPVTTDGRLPPVTRTAGVWALPWLLLGAVLAATGWWVVRWLRRRRAQPVAGG